MNSSRLLNPKNVSSKLDKIIVIVVTITSRKEEKKKILKMRHSSKR